VRGAGVVRGAASGAIFCEALELGSAFAKASARLREDPPFRRGRERTGHPQRQHRLLSERAAGGLRMSAGLNDT